MGIMALPALLLRGGFRHRPDRRDPAQMRRPGAAGPQEFLGLSKVVIRAPMEYIKATDRLDEK